MLIPKGTLIDLRPILDRWSIEVVSARENRQTGRMHDLELGLEDDAAANKAVNEAENNKWFSREHKEFFPIYYVWDSPKDMEEWVDTEWDEFLGLDEEARRATRSAWALGDGDAHVRVQVRMLITKWRNTHYNKT
ncbi:MAG TPA: hypothetical protein VLA72_13490 [Anaerolineales bacterium]|nr:hypothetical protein [Anaerolineales bacterium]